MKPTPIAPPHLYLTGYRGCGKSTIAKELAARLDLPLVDLDEVIESDAGMSIAKIFELESEAGFRDRETQCLKNASVCGPSIISLGGGAILRQSNRDMISETGWCVWLDASPSVIAERLASDVATARRRPSLTGAPVLEEVQKVLESRESLYRQVSDLRIDTSQLTVGEIASIVLAQFPA